MVRGFFNRRDMLIAALVFLLALAAWLVPKLFGDGAGGTELIVTADGEEYERLALPVEGETEIEVNGVTVAVSGSSVRVTDSPCPDRICVRTGEISRPGMSIACVPQRVTVSIRGGRRSGPDAVAY